jgi:hypothetical protein
MYHKEGDIRMKFRLQIILLVLFSIGTASAAIDPETVLAEHSNGTITMQDFNLRLSKVPAMYQGRYQTYEGKMKFLSDLVTEEVFFMEALSMGLDKDPELQEKVQNQIKSTYYTEYQNHLTKTRIQVTDDELYEYFLQNIDDYAGITFDESKTMIERQIMPQKKKEFLENYEEKLWQKYETVIHENLLDSLDFNDYSTIEPIAQQKYVTSNNPALEKTIADLKEFYDGLPNNNKRPMLNRESRLNSVYEITKMDMYYLEAKENGFDDNPVVLETLPMIERNLILREAYTRLITNQIDTTDDTIRKFYHDNIEKFSSKPYRKIQAFGFNDLDTAKKAQNDVKKALKKSDNQLLDEILEKSVFQFDNGEIDYIYKNNLIPKAGTDSLWSKLVWEDDHGKTKPKKLSKIFQSAQNYFVFFRILEDIIPVPTPFEEARTRIENELIQNNSRQLFQETVDSLREKFNVVIYNDNLIEKLSAEEYFSNAENAQKKRRFQDAVYYYDQVCEFHANGIDDYKAMFMKGFLYSEELKDSAKAIAIFEEILEKYPYGELHDSAEFMIEELKGNSSILEKMEKN